MGPFSSITSLLIWTVPLQACGCLWIFCSSLLAFQLGKHRPGKGRRLVQVLERETKQKMPLTSQVPLLPATCGWPAEMINTGLSPETHALRKGKKVREIYPTALRLKGAPQLARKLLPLTLPFPPPPLCPSKTWRAAALLLS